MELNRRLAETQPEPPYTLLAKLATQTSNTQRVIVLEVPVLGLEESSLLVEENFGLPRDSGIIRGQLDCHRQSKRLRTGQDFCGLDLWLAVVGGNYPPPSKPSATFVSPCNAVSMLAYAFLVGNNGAVGCRATTVFGEAFSSVERSLGTGCWPNVVRMQP